MLQNKINSLTHYFRFNVQCVVFLNVLFVWLSAPTHEQPRAQTRDRKKKKMSDEEIHSRLRKFLIIKYNGIAVYYPLVNAHGFPFLQVTGDSRRLWAWPSPANLIFTATHSLGFSRIFCWFLCLFSIFLHQLCVYRYTSIIFVSHSFQDN